MTIIRAEKPAFNLRNKLSELDFGTLPFDKMPSGSIVQSQIKYTGNTTWGSSNASWTDVGPVSGQVDFTMKFTPKLYNSVLVFETDMTTMLNDDDGYARFRLVDKNHPSGTTVLHENTYCAASHYKISTDDWIETHICTKGPVKHMREHNLVLQVYIYNGGSLSFSWSGSDYRTVRVTEIKQ